MTDAVVLAAFQRKFNSNGKNVARTLAKLYAGKPVAVTVALGDSVLQGSTVSSGGGVLGTDDAVSLFCSGLTSRFGSTITKQNRAISGATMNIAIKTSWTAALADNADLYILSGAKNDITYYATSSPGNLEGQTYESAIAQLEAKVVELRAVRPEADIVIMSTNPYTGGSSSNTYQSRWNALAEAVAAAYGCEFVDGFGAFTALGSYDSLSSDGTHPNKAGHAVLGAALLAHFPAGWTPRAAADQGASFFRPPAPGRDRLHTPWKHNRYGQGSMSIQTSATYAPKLLKFGGINGNGAGSWAGTGPWTSSTAGDAVIATVNSDEAFLNLTMGAGQGVIDIYVDGVPWVTSIDLSLRLNGKQLGVTGMGQGWHYVGVRVVSGSVTFESVEYSRGPAGQYVNWDAPSVVAAGMGTSTSLSPSPGGTAVASAAAGTLTLTFVGTGVAAHFWRNGTGGGAYFTSATLDGAAITTPSITPTTATGHIRVPLASGLSFGKHTLVLTHSATGVYTAGFDVTDDQPTSRPAQAQGWAGAAEVVKFGSPFPTVPLVSSKDPSAALTFTSVTATGFTMGATAGWWVANGSDESAGNRVIY